MGWVVAGGGAGLRAGRPGSSGSARRLWASARAALSEGGQQAVGAAAADDARASCDPGFGTDVSVPASGGGWGRARWRGRGREGEVLRAYDAPCSWAHPKDSMDSTPARRSETTTEGKYIVRRAVPYSCHASVLESDVEDSEAARLMVIIINRLH